MKPENPNWEIGTQKRAEYSIHIHNPPRCMKSGASRYNARFLVIATTETKGSARSHHAVLLSMGMCCAIIFYLAAFFARKAGDGGEGGRGVLSW